MYMRVLLTPSFEIIHDSYSATGMEVSILVNAEFVGFNTRNQYHVTEHNQFNPRGNMTISGTVHGSRNII